MQKLKQKLNVNTVGVALLGDPQIKNNTNPVGATIGRPRFEGITLKNQKGITLIALIITIIVMLILVGVTINVALNGGLFDKAIDAKEKITREAEIEALSMAAIAAWDEEKGVVIFEEMQLPDGFTGSDGTYTSSKSGKTYKVDKATAKVTESETQELDEDLDAVKAELEGKLFSEVITGTDANSVPIFNNTEIKAVDYAKDVNGNTIGAILMYKGGFYKATVDDMTLANPKILDIEEYEYDIANIYFTFKTEGTNITITGLTQYGKNDVIANKKIIIPETIKMTDGVTYTVTTIGKNAFTDNKNIEEIKLPNTVTTIEIWALMDCSSIKEFTLPSTVQNLAQRNFMGWTSNQTIYMQGRTEEPLTTDNYSGIGWEHDWKYECYANIVWDK